MIEKFLVCPAKSTSSTPIKHIKVRCTNYAEAIESTSQRKTGSNYVGGLRRDFFLWDLMFMFGEFKEELA